MKLHYSKILLFSLPLNILVSSSSNANNKNKPYIKAHTATTTWRVLSESDPYMPNYDNDVDMKSVKENFDRRTSQRFEEYDERMNEKRQKSKEQRDKNIQKIIHKDKMDKSLAEKVEIGCLRCGCALGGVAASVGIFGTVAVKELTKAAITTATELAKEAVKVGAMAATIKAEGAAAFKSAVIEGIVTKFGVSTESVQGLKSLFTANTYNDVKNIARAINNQYDPSSCLTGGSGSATDNSICTWVMEKYLPAQNIPEMTRGGALSMNDVIETAVKSIVTDAKTVAETAVETATKEFIKASTDAVESTYAICQTAIIASVVALLIIVLVMIILYLVLRYRRKKKMNKKTQYTKLLNQ
ncbi:surface antigen [Plasmodium falciparum UGT5.1]|uniref:Surface antigen n=1 Tax=Plasmodium falciparum UGT5.1 TaxID=1237627 RepID=W7JUT5_PLAFA|nr:surface antigen [Plasmodium falciparum UGT5.1]